MRVAKLALLAHAISMVSLNPKLGVNASNLTKMIDEQKNKERKTARNGIFKGKVNNDIPRRSHLRSLDEQARSDTNSDSESFSTDYCDSVIAVAGTRNPVTLDSFPDEVIVSLEEEFLCEVANGDTIPIDGTDEQLAELREMLNDGEFVSAESTFDMPGIFVSSGNRDHKTLSMPPGKVNVKDGRSREKKRTRSRGLAVLEGTKPVLVIRVTDSTGQVHPDNAETISDKVFGTYGDQATMKSQFAACSFGALNITSDYGDLGIGEVLTAPGVLEVTIPVSLANSRNTIRNAAKQAAENRLGFSLPGPFQNVMYVLKECLEDCGWAAYAYVNSWVSTVDYTLSLSMLAIASQEPYVNIKSSLKIVFFVFLVWNL